MCSRNNSSCLSIYFHQSIHHSSCTTLIRANTPESSNHISIRAYGEPSYDVCMCVLSHLLKQYDTLANQHQIHDNNKKELNCRFQFTIRRTVYDLTYSDKTYFRFKHNFRENIDIYSINETLRADPMKTKTKSAEQKGLYYMTGKLLNTIDLGYTAGSH